MKGSVLVTGATGFLGRRAVDLLGGGDWEVHAVARTALTGRRDGVVWHAADLLANGVPEALVQATRPTHLLHLAWTARPGVFWHDPANVLWTAATLRLVGAFAVAGGTRVVAAGTCAEYDWTYGFCSESVTPLRPATSYGAAKLAVATALEPWAARVGVDFTWVRLFHLYGPGEPAGKLIADVVSALRSGHPVDLTPCEQWRDFLHVDDAARGLVHLLDHGPPQAVNLASGRPVAVRQAIELLGSVSGRPELLHFGVRPTSADEPPLLAADVRRILATGWHPEVALESGLAALLCDAP